MADLSRYDSSARTKKTRDGKTAYVSRIYPDIPLRDDDLYVGLYLPSEQFPQD